MRGLRKYDVDIACPLEVRTPDSVHSVIKVPGEDYCYHPFHSGVVDNSGRHDIAIAPSEATQVALLVKVPTSLFLASARLKGDTEDLIVVAAYAPTIDALGRR